MPCLLLVSTVAQEATTAERKPVPATLESKIQAVLNDPSLKKALVGIDVVALDNGQRIYSLRKDESFVVASNMKLVTTAAALDILGPDYKFRTSVYRTGPLDPATGALKGGLVIRGVGDPNISGRFLNDDVCAVPNAWAAAVRKAGVTEVQGDIIADDTLFDRVYVPTTWPRNQMDHWYCAQVCALSFNDNCLNISIAAAKTVGAPAAVRIEPDTSYVNVTKNCVTVAARKDHAVILARKPDTNDIRVGGGFWIGSPPSKDFITIHNPALYLATVFREALERAGVKVAGKAALADRPMREATVPENEIAASESSLDGTIAVTNQRSQNFYAEQLLKTVGAVKTGQGTFESGCAAVSDFLRRLDGAGSDFVVADGSGLSKTNRLPPALMTALLRHMYEHRFREAYVSSLAQPGEEGSLRKRFTGEPYRGRVLAKTGYVAGASCLSGYLTTMKGRTLAFAIFMNKFSGNNAAMHVLQDRICKALIDLE